MVLRSFSVLLFASLSALAAEEAPFVHLFDGKTMKGWKGDAKHWRVEGGALVGEIPRGQSLRHNTWLIWEGGELKDFELVLQFKLTGEPAANSGIQFRCQAEGINKVSGYQADLDMGATWLGRIYDEHGRALLVERGTRVAIDAAGQRRVERFANPGQFKVLFRENDWNDYRILADGEHMSVEINGTLFSELVDQQKGERDLSGQLAFQLHSGPATRVEFRDVRYRPLTPGQHRVRFKPQTIEPPEAGVVPKGKDGRTLNLGFEDGTLRDWTATGNAFEGQPVQEDTIPDRWAGQVSGKEGQFFIGGYELAKDGPKGKLVSVPFTVTHPFGSLLFNGGSTASTRADVVLVGEPEQVILTATGSEREQMKRFAVDLRAHQGKQIYVRLVDDHSGGWGHLNFDDFRFHESKPASADSGTGGRLRENPILRHLLPNPNPDPGKGPAAETVRQMFIEPGFTADLIAAEPALHQPIAFTFDERGRIWVAEAHSYPQKRPQGEGKDRILVLEDRDGDGAFETHTVFTEGLNLVSGLEVGYGGVWVGAAPELLFIPDRDRDDKPDGPPVVLLDGFGFQDTHETLNSFIWGPDGWLYGNQGVFNFSRIGKPGATRDNRLDMSAGVWRYHPVRKEFEVFAHGGSNQWGLDFNEVGELFMTHCRSHWGRGLTTHVIQGGHYWNQANRGYADFVSSSAPPGYGFFVNYLLASARYGHGEGGAGKRGTRTVYGGHSHVGTMIYLGDNWPDIYRDRLFTHNLHGHQMNQQINRREGSGYNTIHAGRDMLYSPDPAYVAVDLKYGPDGAVYFIDWYDRQHCHNPNTERWDRSNGRLYRMAYADTFKPVTVDLSRAPDARLVELQSHKNDWYGRTARRLLHERASAGRLTPGIDLPAAQMAQSHKDPRMRLRGLWTLHAMGQLDSRGARQLLEDDDEHVRAWTIQLLADDRSVASRDRKRFVAMAHKDPSPVVRRYLASAIQRVPASTGWQLAEALSLHGEDAADRNLPGMIWYGLAALMTEDISRAVALAGTSRMPVLTHYVRWYAAKGQGEGLDRMVEQMAKAADPRDHLEAIALALGGQEDLPMPPAWGKAAPGLYQDQDRRIQQLAHKLGAIFGDTTLFPEMRRILADAQAPLAERQHAFALLARGPDPDSASLLLDLLDQPAFRSDVIRLAARLNHPKTADALLSRFDSFSGPDKASAIHTLIRRANTAEPLLDAIVAKRVDKALLTAFHARELGNLRNAAIDKKLAQVWGKVTMSPEAQQKQIARLEARFKEAPLWAFNAGEGRKLYVQLCSPCHQLNNEGANIGPRLTGSGSNGARYFIENIVDPNAVIGADFQTTNIETKDGEFISGLLEKETATAVTIRALQGAVTVPRRNIASVSLSKDSMMPAGLLEALNERQQIELLKFLLSI